MWFAAADRLHAHVATPEIEGKAHNSVCALPSNSN